MLRRNNTFCIRKTAATAIGYEVAGYFRTRHRANRGELEAYSERGNVRADHSPNRTDRGSSGRDAVACRRGHLRSGDRSSATVAWRPRHLLTPRPRPLDPRSPRRADRRPVFRQLPRNALARLRVALRSCVRTGLCRRRLDRHGGSRIGCRRNGIRSADTLPAARIAADRRAVRRQS